ncbi:MAG: hypothetical protein RJB65_2194, partial [Actinomycetota bacterium]
MTVRIRHLATLALALVAAAGLLWSSPAHAADTCDVAGIKVMVKDQSGPKKVPVEGVVAIVKDEAGAEVGRGTTDAKGGALICVPSKTTFTVEIDQTSLKDGMALDGEAVATVDEDSFTTSTKTMS